MPLRVRGRSQDGTGPVRGVSSSYYVRYLDIPGALSRLSTSGIPQTADTGIFSAGRQLIIPADAGTFTITGTDATLSESNNVVIACDPGTFVVTGTIATLSISSVTSEAANSWFNDSWWVAPTFGASWWGANYPSFEITADAGSFTVTGTAATLSQTGDLVADAGSFVITGADATLTIGGYGRGEFSITGTATVLGYNRSITAEAGSFVITGTDIRFDAISGISPAAKYIYRRILL